MTVAKSNNANVQLLVCLVDPQDAITPDDSHYRFLVDGKYVKYVTTAPGTLAGEEMDWIFGPILLSELLPPFPPGKWNKGHVAKDPETGQAAFIETVTESLPGVEVECLWHPVRLNELDFAQVESVRQRVRIATHPELNDGKPVFLKLAVWPWEIAFAEAEMMAYELIHDKGVGPKFLGNLTEGKDGRVVGFITEWVQDARAAGPGDLESCRKALERLHELGIKHGDINKHNFLVREGHDVVLVDFETAKKCSPQELEDEMNALEENLNDPSFRGGVERICE
ncbi:hypothetical protein BDN70DRAFT_871879 [Pholiota conissans]|uniref:Uncharacterized protein n=1 Tax=Pholiota conissans TaxID=109636 RepID=A0A9P6D5U3_9AGAR|nr:hypothetical protein BDN70DRAFT_871879 [Pholiota conissans]